MKQCDDISALSRELNIDRRLRKEVSQLKRVFG
jgi:hypothetical protein